MDRRPSYLEEAILSPGNVKIKVQGAFIAEEEKHWIDGMQHDTRDIRLPNHRTVVSHVALDVQLPKFLDILMINANRFQIGGSLAKLVYFSREPDSKELGGLLKVL